MFYFCECMSVCSANIFALVFDLIIQTLFAVVYCVLIGNFSTICEYPVYVSSFSPLHTYLKPYVQTERLFFVGYDFVRPLWGWSPVPLLWYFSFLSLVPQSWWVLDCHIVVIFFIFTEQKYIFMCLRTPVSYTLWHRIWFVPYNILT